MKYTLILKSYPYYVTFMVASSINVGGTLNEFYFGYFRNFGETPPLTYDIVVTTTESEPVFYNVEIPGLGYSDNGTVQNWLPITFPRDVVVSSIDDRDHGIYLKTSSDNVNVAGFNVQSESVDSFRVLPVTKLNVDKYTYYAISIGGTQPGGLFKHSILIVGTEDSTAMELTVTQPVEVNVDGNATTLVPNTQYSFEIDKLQTVYIASIDDLTGSKIVTNKPVSVFSGHEAARGFSGSDLDHMVEQVPPTALWDTVHYFAPLANDFIHTVRIVAAEDSTDIDIYCNDTLVSYTIDESHSVYTTIPPLYCAIYSNKKILVAQFGHHSVFSNSGGTLMIQIPGTSYYSNRLEFTTNPISNFQDHYFNLVVLKEYYQPERIWLLTSGFIQQLNNDDWVPIIVNNVTVAYGLQYPIGNYRPVVIVHTNPAAKMTASVYGFNENSGYGHSAGYNLQTSDGMSY